jgi:hypothetical protein
MWRFILSGAGVIGMTLLLLAGSLAPWSFDGGMAPTGQSALPVVTPAMLAPAEPAPSADIPERPVPSTIASEEDAMRLALAALASVPLASPSNVSAAAPLPSAASRPPKSVPNAITPVIVPLAPVPPAPSTTTTTTSHHAIGSPNEARYDDVSTEDLNQQSLAAARAGQIFIPKTMLHGSEGRAQ